MKTFLFTVVIPHYNRQVGLQRALKSLAAQTFDRFEVIVVDDGSVVSPSSALEEFKDRLNIKLITIEHFGGPARPRNIGINSACGEWICFLDSDDTWAPNKLATILDLISSAAVDVVYHRLVIVDKDGKPRRLRSLLGKKITDNPFYYFLCVNNPIPLSTVVVRKAVFTDRLMFSESRDSIAVEDFDLWIRMSLADLKFLFLPRALGRYYESDDSISRDPAKTIMRNVRLHEKYMDFLPEKMRPYCRAKIHYLTGSIQMNAKQFSRAILSFSLARPTYTKALAIKREIKTIKARICRLFFRENL